MGKVILIGFILFRLFLAYSKYQSKNANKPKKKAAPKSKALDFDELIKQFEQKTSPKPKPATISSSDSHRAEEDSGKKLDWQNVRTSSIKEKEQLLKHSNYSNTSHRNVNVEKIEIVKKSVLQKPSILDEEIDLRKAVIYKEILERKYFSI